MQHHENVMVLIRYSCMLNLGGNPRNNTLFYSYNGCFLRKKGGKGALWGASTLTAANLCTLAKCQPWRISAGKNGMREEIRE